MVLLWKKRLSSFLQSKKAKKRGRTELYHNDMILQLILQRWRIISLWYRTIIERSETRRIIALLFAASFKKEDIGGVLCFKKRKETLRDTTYKKNCALSRCFRCYLLVVVSCELLRLRITGIEPISSAWKADNLPLIYIRIRMSYITTIWFFNVEQFVVI